MPWSTTEQLCLCVCRKEGEVFPPSFLRVCVCVYAYACVRAFMRACVRAYVCLFAVVFVVYPILLHREDSVTHTDRQKE